MWELRKNSETEQGSQPSPAEGAQKRRVNYGTGIEGTGPMKKLMPLYEGKD